MVGKTPAAGAAGPRDEEMYPTRVSSDKEEGPDDADLEYLARHMCWKPPASLLLCSPKILSQTMWPRCFKTLENPNIPQTTSLSVSLKSKLVPQNITKYLPTSATNPV